ncbi:MAG: hypothetical protein JSS61_04785 [Verrucomicrobia bacterium]|nr:hypothetical protein [Verrucomicrobiota bacterium]
MQRYYTCLALLLCASLPAEKIVQLVTNFPVSEEYYTQELQKRGFDGKVVVTDLATYPKGWKGKGWWERTWRKIPYLRNLSIPDPVEKIVFFNITSKEARRFDFQGFPKEKLVLFMWEPPLILHRMYAPDLLENFSRVYTFHDALVDNKRFFKFNYPALRPMLEKIPSFEEKKLCTLVSTDLESKYPEELYSERRAAIRFFEEVGETGFAFYGRRWDSAHWPSYQGPIADKIDAIKDYRFAICYENCEGTPGYISEKIFDCFAAGTVPIYWGAPNIGSHIPKECYIDRTAFTSMDALYHFLKNMPKEEYEAYLLAIRSFLDSEKAQPFSLDAFSDAFYEAITSTTIGI